MVFRPFTLQFHIKLKPRFSELIKNAFMCKNGKKCYEYIVVGHNSTYFVKKINSEDNAVRMIDFLIDDIFVECGGVILQQVIGIPMGTICALLLADLLLYSYKATFIQTLIGHQGKSKRSRLLCYAGRKSPSRQLDDFEIVMLTSSFIQKRRSVTPASLLLSF